LLYQADLVPVGDDQKQHLELTRDLALRFNHRYGEFFTIPQGYIPPVGKRIMSLDDASKKMSKSNPNPGSYLALLDPPDVIRKKISRATTGSGREVKYDPQQKPELSNLISIYAACSGLSISEVEQRYEGQMYGGFKKELAEVVVARLEPIQQRYREIRSSGELTSILRDGAMRAAAVADQTVRQVKDRMGFLLS
jgi:tryptophanyl-tRNA synthetase